MKDIHLIVTEKEHDLIKGRAKINMRTMKAYLLNLVYEESEGKNE